MTLTPVSLNKSFTTVSHENTFQKDNFLRKADFLIRQFYPLWLIAVCFCHCPWLSSRACLADNIGYLVYDISICFYLFVTLGCRLTASHHSSSRDHSHPFVLRLLSMRGRSKLRCFHRSHCRCWICWKMLASHCWTAFWLRKVKIKNKILGHCSPRAMHSIGIPLVSLFTRALNTLKWMWKFRMSLVTCKIVTCFVLLFRGTKK